MARVRGAGFALKGFQWFLRAVEFCCGALILAVFSYFLATLHNHNLNIDNFTRAIEGISGAAALYTLIGLVLLCFLAGLTFFSLLALILDIAFVGAFIFVAYETRGGAGSCSGTVTTPYGTGNADGDNTVPSGDGGSTILPSFKTACRLETACFSVAIVAIFFFLLSALMELALMRHYRKEKAFGPSPGNNYTAGSTPRKQHFWQRNRRDEAALAAGGIAVHEKRQQPDALPSHSTPGDMRNSYNTENTEVGTEAPYNKHHSNEQYAAPNANYREPEYAAPNANYRESEYSNPNANYREPGYTAAAGAVGGREAYTGAGPTTATHDSAYPAADRMAGREPVVGTTAGRETGYRTSTTSAAYNPHLTQAGEIPAREYLDNSIHNNY